MMDLYSFPQFKACGYRRYQRRGELQFHRRRPDRGLTHVLLRDDLCFGGMMASRSTNPRTGSFVGGVVGTTTSMVQYVTATVDSTVNEVTDNDESYGEWSHGHSKVDGGPGDGYSRVNGGPDDGYVELDHAGPNYHGGFDSGLDNFYDEDLMNTAVRVSSVPVQEFVGLPHWDYSIVAAHRERVQGHERSNEVAS
ncbi:hypothetical protein BBJ29_009987 [Phytophthora kernoviae]|uniref:Uncharacterized protein n=1 Tax=Phytophthora kernoviae TaxID=325452 RepID=A0A3F2RCG4_9STRA|nr:hypothetical protein BBP00_00009948 [Phytophthora kernoviae]RLN60611.1 hypothetical protein BBJ29_009987 [Phytophthora kernoviae]